MAKPFADGMANPFNRSVRFPPRLSDPAFRFKGNVLEIAGRQLR